MNTFSDWRGLPPAVKAHFYELEDFIGGVDGDESIDNGTIDAADAVEAVNAIAAEIARLSASELAWKLIAKLDKRWNALPQSEKEAALQKALESAIADLVQAEDKIERLEAFIWSLDRRTICIRGEGDTFIDVGVVVASDIVGGKS